MSQLQVKEGIDAVIVDNVLAIRKGLTESGVEPEFPPPDTASTRVLSANGTLSPRINQQPTVDAMNGVPTRSQRTDGGDHGVTFSS